MEVMEAAGYLRGMMMGGINFAHIITGINAGLFDGIAKHGETGVEPATLALEYGYFEDYVRFWCESAYSIQILDHVGNGHFRLAEGFGPLLTANTPVSITSMMKLFEVFVKERFEHHEFMRTGSVRTWEDHSDHLSKVMAELSAPRGEMIVENLYKQFPEAEQKLRGGARLLEVGCGAGSTLIALAREFPDATFVGTDVDGYALDLGEGQLGSTRFNDRVQFRKLGAEELDYQEEFDIVVMAIVMHELRPELRPKAIRKIWRALRTDGLLMSTDFLYPSDIEDYRKPEYSFAVLDQASECIWGNRHLTQEQLADLCADSGFQRSEFHQFQYPNDPVPRLTVLAFK